MKKGIKEKNTCSDSYLIILGAGPQQIAAYQAAKKFGIKTLAVDYNPKSEAIPLADKFLLASIKNKEECLTRLSELATKGVKFSGVVTLAVEVSPIVSAIAKEFNLLAVSEETAYKTTNKCARSEALQKAGIPMPDFEVIEKYRLPKMKYPFVIKPSDSSGSRGVRIVDSEKEWPEAYKKAKEHSSDGRVIIEELLKGSELSIEGFVLNGKMIVTFLGDRTYAPNQHPYFCEDGCISPSLLPDKTVSEAKEVFAKAAKALGITAGASKGDLIATKEGVKVIEITSRLSPALSRIMPYMTGQDIIAATVLHAAGRAVPKEVLEPRFNKAAALLYSYHTPGRILKITGMDKLNDQPGIAFTVMLKDFKVGDVLGPLSYMNHLYYVFTVANDRKTAVKLAQNALDSVKIITEPVKPSENIVAILQARLGSSRLPRKVLMDIEGKPMLWHIIERLKQSKIINNIVVATTDKADDREIVEAAKKIGTEAFAGSENDVLDRFYQTAKKFKADTIVRITGDCAVIDPEVVDEVLRYHFDGGYDISGLIGEFPDGLDVTVFSFKTLERTWNEANLQSEREHVCPYMENHPEKFKMGKYEKFKGLKHHRWCVDEENDLKFIRTVYKELYKKKKFFNTQDILDLLERKPELMRINQGIIRNEGYLKSLKDDKVVR